MSHRSRAVLAIACGATFLASCTSTGGASTSKSTTASTGATGSSSSTQSTTASESPSATTDPAQTCATRIADSLSPSEQAAQLLMVGMMSDAGVDSVTDAVSRSGVGGVILLGGWNGKSAVSAATKQLDALAQGPGLFLAADQEGGQVQQLKGAGFSTIPSAQNQAAMASDLRAAATTWGAELRAAGINVNLAPDADTVPADIGTANGPIGRYHREYGATPEAVIPPMTAFLKGMQDAGVMTSVKHFPGIGRISGNTDTASTGISDTTATVDDPHLKPFVAGIEAGSDFVMISSAYYPKIAAAQALFAPEIVTDLLRGDLGFKGVVITDDVGAAAAVRDVPVGDRATRFIAAGGDVVLTAVPADVPVMVKAITHKAANDPVFAEQTRDALIRVLTLKARRALLNCSGG